MPRPNVSEARKTDILAAAEHVFTTQGLNTARMDDVAVAAGISKGTIYLYYPSKEKLTEALLHRLFEPLEKALDQLQTSDAPIRERLRHYAFETISIFANLQPVHALVLELFALSRRQAYAETLFAAYFVRYRESLRASLSMAAEQGAISLLAFHGEAAQAALSFIAQVEGLLLVALVNPQLLNLEQDGKKAIESWLQLLDV